MRAAGAAGWGTWIRTKTNRVRVCCATVTPFPNGLPSAINSLFGYPGKSHAAGPGQIAARWSQRSTRLILPLASAEAEAFFVVRAAGGRTLSGMPKLWRRRRLPRVGWRHGATAVAHASAIPFVQRLRAKRAVRTSCDQWRMSLRRTATPPNLPAYRGHAMLALPNKKATNGVAILRGRFVREPAPRGRTLWETIA